MVDSCICGLLNGRCLECFGELLKPLLSEVLQWLALEVKDATLKAIKQKLEDGSREWRRVVQCGLDQGLEIAKELLHKSKQAILKFLNEYCTWLEQFAKLSTKSLGEIAVKKASKKVATTLLKKGARRVTTIAVREAGEKVVVTATKKTIVNVAAKQSAKSIVKAAANPIGIVADLSQAGLEVAGYKKAGQAVGMGGNILYGAAVGGTIGGPPGAVLGATGGFLLWGAGEIVGNIVGSMFH